MMHTAPRQTNAGRSDGRGSFNKMTGIPKEIALSIRRKYQVDRVKSHLIVEKRRNKNVVNRRPGHPHQVTRKLLFHRLRKHAEALL